MLSGKCFPRIYRGQEAEYMAGLINKLVPQGFSVFRHKAANTHNSKLHEPQSNYPILLRVRLQNLALKTWNSVGVCETAPFDARMNEEKLPQIGILTCC